MNAGMEQLISQNIRQYGQFRQEQNTMGFINEFISEDDSRKTGIKDIAKRFGGPIDRSWTIDRERNMYLHCVNRGREDYRSESTWIFYWHGDLVVVWLSNISTEKKASGERQGHKKLRRIEIPQHLEHRRAEILTDLKEALTTDGCDGLYAKAAPYELILDI